jgi:UDP-N-acetylglucosamine 4,6-dehydratase/5-epimerase
VIFAFQNGMPGDIFVQKAPASTIEVLAKALLKLYNANNPIKIIGTRHGEKLYETLVNREELAKAVDLGNYYRIPADTRDLNYNRYFVEGETQIAKIEEYTSHNTHRMNLEETQNLLLQLDSVRSDIEKLK